LGKDIQDLAKHYFETGITRIKGGDHRAALSDFKKSLAYNPDNQTVDKLVTYLEKKIHTEDKKIDSLLAEGINFQKRQWYISATLCYLQILELNPGHKKAQKNIKLIKPMVDVYIEKTYQGGVNYFEQGEYHQAREVFKRVLSLRKDHEGAKRYLQQIEDIFTTAAQDHFIRGLGYYSQKNLEKAREEFTNALKYDPQSEEIKQHLEKVEAEILEVEARVKKLLKEAEILEKKGQYVKASLKYNEVLQLDKNNRLATENLQKIQKYVEVYVRNKYREGETLFNNQDLRGAERAFKDLLSVSPNHRQAKLYLDRIQASIAQESAGHYEAGLKYYADRRWEKASDEFEKVLEIDPGHKEAAKKREEALSLMSLESLLKKARTYYANKDYLKALEAFHQMLESHPNNSQAQEYIEKCQQQLNQMVEEYFNVGMAYYTEENYEAALREWDKVLKINPDHRGALEYRKRALERVQALQELP
ncbi:MAG: tetratricopeptide repeat protein, partial [candidate division KSB1 bacterium]|nr:tetratricopeptide repeat protein [candidate division KSB1 bacterium]